VARDLMAWEGYQSEADGSTISSCQPTPFPGIWWGSYVAGRCVPIEFTMWILAMGTGRLKTPCPHIGQYLKQG
jgi:hypothetical protein